MDNTKKLRVILQHWIDHNGGHVAEFDKWRDLMAEEGKGDIASSLDEAKKRMDSVSELLASILKSMGGPVEGEEHHHHHHHHHHHD